MTLPAPVPGRVLRYAYLWRQEADTSREEASKDRPCVIVLTALDASGRTHVVVVPITHRPPDDPADAIEIPAITKRRLGLDEARSWIVVIEVNQFVWPGPDLRPDPRLGPESAAIGTLPPRFFALVRDRFVQFGRAGRVKRVHRTE